MTSLILQRVRRGIGSVGLSGVLGAAAVAALPASVMAGHHDDHRDRPHGQGIYVDVSGRPLYGDETFARSGRTDNDVCAPDQRVDRVWVEPVYRTVCDRQWVAPVYRTVCDRVWIEPVCQKVCERVRVPDRWEWRNVIHPNHLVTRERVLVERAHDENREREVVVAPGHFEDRQRQELVCDGHWQNVERQEVVTPGHWETRSAIAVDDSRRDDNRGPFARIDLRFPLGR